ncbi:MAG: ATP-binding protein [Cyclobacteriaceae bacterium]
MIDRALSGKINALRKKYPVLTLTGPRQTGKTTLLKALYKDLPYVSLEDLDNRSAASTDPRGFLSNFPIGAVIDEIQQVPSLLSYIQTVVDSKDVHFALSGSHNFQLLQSITQSLAGRTAILKLLPFSYTELVLGGFKFDNYEQIVFRGAYPRIYDKGIEPIDFYPSYTNTYIERDVRQIKNIEDLNAFSLFLRLCAGRIGQVLNIQSLATDAGISPNTAKSWLSVLEASYIIYLHKPHFQNFNKRLVKSPKLYFYDTGLACSLLHINALDQLATHYLKGGLFENYVINEVMKAYLNLGMNPPLYFWQSKDKKEVDIIIDSPSGPIPYEIKSSKTRMNNLFGNLIYWQKLTNARTQSLQVIYGGDEDFNTSMGRFISWGNISQHLPIK